MATEKHVSAAMLGKMAKLLEAARELQVKHGEVLDELDALLSGKAGIGAEMKALEKAFDAAWCGRYAPGQTGRYVWRWKIDRPQQKRLITRLGLEEVIARIAHYIASDEPFYVRQQHPFLVFVGSINSHPGLAAVTRRSQAEGCQHDPRCTSDAEHTQRKLAEMRA